MIPKPGSAWRPIGEYDKGPNGDGKINKDSVEVPRDIEAGKQVQRHMIAIIGEYRLWSKRQANSINICISVLFATEK